MGLFTRKSASALPPEILAAVHTMKDDLDGKAPTPQIVKASAVPATGSASPFVFSAAPALKNLSPVNENGLASTITITGTDTTNAHADPKESSPFLKAGAETADVVMEDESVSPLALDALPTPPPAPAKPAPNKMYSSLEPNPASISFMQEGKSKQANFVSENVTLGSEDPVYKMPDEISQKKKGGMLVVGVILLGIALVAGGVFAYFTFFTETSVTPPQNVPAKDVPLSTNPTDTSERKEYLPFTLSSPNYLSIDVETITAEQFRTLLSEKEGILVGNKIINTPVEFLITDKNNNPVAFPRFVKLLGMVFPQAIMDQTDEAFSLYLTHDTMVARVGLAISLKNKDLLSRAVTSGESALPFALQALYLDPSVTKITSPVWKSGTYKSYSTRYCNIAPTGLSNDYTLTEKHWIIGTSANSFRNILDTFGMAL